jgi:EmrB/QacA subfamily drug resistance transporter
MSSIPTPRPPAERTPAERAHLRRWLVLAVLGVAQLMVILDATVMNVALPSAQRALGFSDADRQWVVTAYALSFGSLLLLGGRLSDLLGRRATFLIGLSGFAAASALGGAAQNFEVLVGARALQGVFGALLAPAALSLLSTTFTDPRERGKAFGIFGALAGAGGAIGLLLGGTLTTYASWRWAMYVNIVFAAVAIVGAAALLPKHVRGTRQRLDVKGTLAVSAGLFALVYGLSHAESAGWGDGVTLGFLAAALVLLAAFAVLQTRVANPLLPPRVLLDRDRAGSYLSVLIVGSGMFAVFLFLTYYLQATLGYSAVRTGVAFLPMVASIMVSASLSTAVLLRRVGARRLVTVGMVVAALGMIEFARLQLTSGYTGDILPGLILSGLGLGLVMAPTMQTAISGVDVADAGVASAMVNTTQQVGGSVGVALLSTVASSSAAGFLDGRTPDPLLLAQATMHSYSTAFWWAAGIFALGAVVGAAMLRPGAPAPAPADVAQPAFAH